MKGSESLWIGVGVGCSLLLLCALCILGAVGMWFAQSAASAPLSESWTPELLPERRTQPPISPWPPTAGPTTGPTPGPSTPPTVGPATPLGVADRRVVRATVTEVSGLADVPVGSTCTADVTRRDLEDGTFWCHADILCAGRALFGGLDSGFFHCVLYEGARRDVVGRDGDTTRDDRDAAMSLDTRAGTLELRDDATGAHGELRVLARVDAID